MEEKQDQGATSVEKLEQDGFQSDKQLDQDATCASEGELDQDAESGEKLDQDAESREKLDQDAESGSVQPATVEVREYCIRVCSFREPE